VAIVAPERSLAVAGAGSRRSEMEATSDDLLVDLLAAVGPARARSLDALAGALLEHLRRNGGEVARGDLGDAADRLYNAFLAAYRNEHTREAYARDLDDFRAFLREATPQGAVARLISLRGAGAAQLAFAYRAHMLGRKCSPATVNRRLSALRSLVKLARRFGFVEWVLEVDGEPKGAPYRETRGPGHAGVLKLLESVRRATPAYTARDRAILRLLFDLALRSKEVRTLELEHVDLEKGTVSILGKKRTERETLTLPPQTRQALEAWIEVRGREPGPLWRNLDHVRGGKPLSARSIYRIVRRHGEAVGIRARPHGLRHAAITHALDITGGDVRKVQRFSRHRDLATLVIYDDNRTDMGGEVARRVAQTLVEPGVEGATDAG
jgi:integrase/recombinase XerC